MQADAKPGGFVTVHFSLSHWEYNFCPVMALIAYNLLYSIK